jgi:hypothetical protein
MVNAINLPLQNRPSALNSVRVGEKSRTYSPAMRIEQTFEVHLHGIIPAAALCPPYELRGETMGFAALYPSYALSPGPGTHPYRFGFSTCAAYQS